jgi:hypothetical protein
MNPEDREHFTPEEWVAFEDELIDRAREIARRLAEGVRRAAADPGGEVPVFG